RGGAGPRRDSGPRRPSGETGGVTCLSLAADGADRGGIPVRAVGARAEPRGVPTFLYRARQRSRGPRNGRRLLGEPDLFAGAIFRGSPGREERGERRLCRRGRSAVHAAE